MLPPATATTLNSAIYTLLLKLLDILILFFLPGMHPELVYLHIELLRQAAK